MLQHPIKFKNLDFRKLSSEKGMRTSPTMSEGYAISDVNDYGLKASPKNLLSPCRRGRRGGN
jgi:hypothetical protein